MVKKVKPIVSKAQAAHVYQEYKAGKIPYETMMAAVHATGDMSTLPDRIHPKKLDAKTILAIKGMI